MGKGRLEAFSDGVIAIIITIMVLGLSPPHEQSLSALKPLAPMLLGYVLSFIYVGIYWNNHHHLMHAVLRVDGSVLWANLHLLFWLSLFPFATSWVGETHIGTVAVAVYGGVLLMAGMAYLILTKVLIAAQGAHSLLATAVGKDWKGKASLVLYIVGAALAFWNARVGFAVYILVASLWLIPDRRISRQLDHKDNGA